jgi:N-acyl homoserine lactone hydrolase
VSIRVFSTGRVRQKRGERGVRRYFADDWSTDTLPINVFLIEHASGLALVDAGQSAEAAAGKHYFPKWYPYFRLAKFELSPHETAAAQLVAAGVPVRDIRWVVLTHLHTDHVGGINEFGEASVLVSRAEWEPAQGMGGQLRGYLPQHWPATIQPRVVDFTGPAVGPFRASYDVAADGRLLFVPLAGHTRGHAALLVRHEAHTVLCAGDAAHTVAELARTAPDVAAWCHRENVTVLLTHDDDAPALAASASSIAVR